jgi:N-acetylglucosamine-6-sulfatase
MSRRLVALAVALFAVAGMGTAVPPAAGQAEPERPNIVFILTDDQRWDTVRGFMPIVEAELLAKGLEFENTYATNPLCCPSRATILTGLYAINHGVWDNHNGPHGGFAAMDDTSTIATWLDDAGYNTAMIGKYQNGYDATGGTYIPPGWDEWFILMDGNYYNYTITDNGVPRYIPSIYSTDLFATEADTFIRHAPADEPFFLMFTPRAPHGPYTPANRHNGAFADREPYRSPSWLEANVKDKPAWIRRLEPYEDYEIDTFDKEQIDSLESLLAVDEAVGRILDALEDTGRLENTLIVFTSDNGYEWGEHRYWGKNTPYESSLRLPLIMRWDAGGIVPESTTSAVVSNLDFAPTFAAVAGVTPPTPVDGLSLARFFADPNAQFGRKGVLVEHTLGGKLVPAYCGWRTEDELYVRYETGEEEYYRYSTDPHELRNLASKPSMSDLVARYRSITRLRCRPLPIGMSW